MECARCGLTIGLGCAGVADHRPRSRTAKRANPRRNAQTSTSVRTYLELRSLFDRGIVAWSDLGAVERAALTAEQRGSAFVG